MPYEDEVFQQDLADKADFQHLFQMVLLFQEQSRRPEAQAVRAALEARFGPVDLVTGAEGGLYSFAVKRYPVTYKDGVQVPAQVLMAGLSPFDASALGPLERSQFWDCPEGDALVDGCPWQLMLCDMMSAGLPCLERCALLTGWLYTALDLFPDCAAVWVPSSGKLLTRQTLLDSHFREEVRFLHFGVNARFFRVQGSEDMVVDTLGLYAVGLPDVQYHFHGLDPNLVVNHAYNAASYLFENDAPIQDGETIDGLLDGKPDQSVQWPCQFEDALIQPARVVMDICPGIYASGGRG